MRSASPLNVAIIGAGIGREHLRGYLQLPDRFDVTCLCDIDVSRAQEVIEEEGADPGHLKVSDNADTVLANKAFDLVDICLPPHLHAPTTIAALRAGKHVICEKPLAGSLEEADRMIDVARTAGRFVFPVFQYRYGPAIAKLQALIRNGFTGKPLIASVETHWNRDDTYYANPWRGTWRGEQGGAILGHAIHNHDLLCAVFGPIRRISAFGGTRVNPIETEDCAALSFQMENGALATSSVTLGAFNDTTRLKFCFEHMTVESDLIPYMPAEGNWTFDVRGTKFSQNEIDAFLQTIDGCRSGFTGYLEAVADTLQYGGKNAVTLEDGRRSIELVSAIYDAMRNGGTVELPLGPDHPLYKGWVPQIM